MRTVLEIILALFGAIAIAGGFVLLYAAVAFCVLAGGCWYAVRRYRGGRRVGQTGRQADKR